MLDHGEQPDRDEPPATHALKRLDVELNKLDTMVEELVGRLDPILAPSRVDPVDTGLLAEVHEPRSFVVGTLDRCTAKTWELHKRLRAAVERLDV